MLHDHSTTAVNQAVVSQVGDYVAEEKAIQSGTAHHDADFKAVCMSAQSAAKQMLAGNHVFYEHIAKLTTWFPTVEGTPYLDTLIKDKTKKHTKKRCHTESTLFQ